MRHQRQDVAEEPSIVRPHKGNKSGGPFVMPSSKVDGRAIHTKSKCQQAKPRNHRQKFALPRPFLTPMCRPTPRSALEGQMRCRTRESRKTHYMILKAHITKCATII